jgi:hypothetical protein
MRQPFSLNGTQDDASRNNQRGRRDAGHPGRRGHAYLGLTTPDEPMPTRGWIALGPGVVFSLIVGIGLMTLLFYSSRRGYDEPAHFQPDDRRDR